MTTGLVDSQLVNPSSVKILNCASNSSFVAQFNLYIHFNRYFECPSGWHCQINFQIYSIFWKIFDFLYSYCLTTKLFFHTAVVWNGGNKEPRGDKPIRNLYFSNMQVFSTIPLLLLLCRHEASSYTRTQYFQNQFKGPIKPSSGRVSPPTTHHGVLDHTSQEIWRSEIFVQVSDVCI